jgi:hypothetical protein
MVFSVDCKSGRYRATSHQRKTFVALTKKGRVNIALRFFTRQRVHTWWNQLKSKCASVLCRHEQLVIRRQQRLMHGAALHIRPERFQTKKFLAAIQQSLRLTYRFFTVEQIQ